MRGVRGGVPRSAEECRGGVPRSAEECRGVRGVPKGSQSNVNLQALLFLKIVRDRIE